MLYMCLNLWLWHTHLSFAGSQEAEQCSETEIIILTEFITVGLAPPWNSTIQPTGIHGHSPLLDHHGL